MPNHGGNQGGRPGKLTAEMIEPICAAIREGCYATVAAGRVGVSQFALYLWDQRGQRESDQREERRLRGEPGDEPPSVYEQLHVALAQAKAEARYSAETRVWKAMPLHWLTKGYARRDWHDSNQLVREVVDELMRRVHAEQYAAFLAAGDPPHEPTAQEQYAHQEMMRFANPDKANEREQMRRHVQKCPICRANAAAGTADWDADKWDAILGSVVSARTDAEGGTANGDRD